MNGSIDYEVWWKPNRFSDARLFKNATRAGKLLFIMNQDYFSS